MILRPIAQYIILLRPERWLRFVWDYSEVTASSRDLLETPVRNALEAY
jgi:hypothetical protein